MKKIIFLLFVSGLFLLGCEEDETQVPIDFTELNALLEEASSEADPSKEGEQGGDIEFGATQTLLDAIERFGSYTDTATNQGTVDSAVRLLTYALDAYRSSIVVVDNTSLLQSIAAAQAILDAAGPEGSDIGNQIIGSTQAFQNAIDAAQVIADNTTATQGELNQAETTLNVAVVVFQASIVADTDFTALNDAISLAENLVLNAVEGTESGQYEQGSISTLQTAIDEARAIATNQSSQQIDVDNALSNLNTAIQTFEAGKVVPPSYLKFEGDDYIKVNGFQAVAGGGARTCEAWVRTESAQNNLIILSWGENSNSEKWDMRLHNGNRALRIEYNGGGVVGTTPLNDGQWHHVAIVVPAEGSPLTSVIMYVDGQPEATSQASGGNPINTSSLNDFEIGRSAAQPSRYWIGDLTEIRIWDRALSATEIADQFNARLVGNENGLIGYWKLNDGNGTTAQDSSVNGNAGTLGGDIGTSASPLWTEQEADFPLED